MNNQIIAEVSKGIGWLTLNRSEKLNALSVEMIDELYRVLSTWKDSDKVSLVVLQGSGEKAFCAGGDVRHLYDLKGKNVETVAEGFFSTEYKMNQIMHGFGKPILVYMNGIVMGGGVGIAVAGSHRIVTETTKWAMPEMNIGLYPDVGGSYFLSRMPFYIGRYLALTSNVIKAGDILYSGAADVFMPSTYWKQFCEELEAYVWDSVDVKDTLESIIDRYSEPCPHYAEFKELAFDIESHFGKNDVEDIVDSLKQASDACNVWAERTLETILLKSPTSLKVTLEQLRRGETSSIKECFLMELDMSMNFMKGHDFFEGVRSVLVDKDRSPSWKPDRIEAVSREVVESYFTYEWPVENPLIQFSRKSI